MNEIAPPGQLNRSALIVDMKRWLLSVLCGSLITVVLTVIAFSDGTSRETARILLWQVTLLAHGVPHGNIGTAESILCTKALLLILFLSS